MRRGEKDRLEKIKESQERAAAERHRLVDRMKARLKQTPPAAALIASRNVEPEQRRMAGLDVECALEAAKLLRFMRLDPSLEVQVGPVENLNRPSVTLLCDFLTALRSGMSATVLQWPFGQRDASILHPLAMLAVLCAPRPQIRAGNSWCKAVADFRTLYFPWRGGATGAAQRLTLVDRSELVKRNGRHLMRRQIGEPDISDQLRMLHETLGHLSRLSLRDASKPHLAHPTLAEFYPVFVAENGDRLPFHQATGELFGRVRYGAALDQLRDHRADICEPASAPFGLYGVSANSDLDRVFEHGVFGGRTGAGRSPDICLLDLGPPAMTRLGHGWEEYVERFLTRVIVRFPETPVLAVTQDSYAHRRVANLIDAARGNSVGRLKVTSAVLLRVSDDLLTPDPPIDIVTPIRAEVHSVAGAATEALSALSDAARGSSDFALAGTLRRGMGSLRRALSLPCGLRPAYDILCEVEGQDAANAFLERRSAATLLLPIQRAIEAGVSSAAERTRLVEAETAVKQAFSTLDAETPIGSLAMELMASLVRKSSRSVVVFGSEIEKTLGQRRFSGDSELAQAVRRRIAGGHMKFVSADALEKELGQIEASREKNSWNRLVLIAPTMERLAAVVARPWLPQTLVVVCDLAFAGRLAAIYRNLASHPELAGQDRIGGRMTILAAAAHTEANARAVAPVNLELEARPIVFSSEEVIDLTEDGDEGREVVVFSLQSGRTLRARPGSVIVRHRRDAEINPFERATAREIAERTSIVVPDRAFVEEARRVLPVEVLAQSWVTVYHKAVEAALPQIVGVTLTAKARTIIDQMPSHGAHAVNQGTVVDWLRVADHMAEPAERRRPHAPQKRREFEAFMATLGPSALADKVWEEGVEPLRNDRRRAGLRMAQAFISVLVDPHGASMGLDLAVKQKIVTLRTRALDHLDAVVSRETLDSSQGQVA